MQDITLYTANFLPWQQSVDLPKLRRPHSFKHFLTLATSIHGCPAGRPPVPGLKYKEQTIASGTSLYHFIRLTPLGTLAMRLQDQRELLAGRWPPASRTISNLHVSPARRYSWLLSAREAPGDRHWFDVA
ncbi:hypothetical protein N7G274_004350 [Stereocaulon virgatum]|uniref:Uncharacterized protein n=1 Tax=Stereocaulon virgatum TaxID=373712 RepID=A0ABR4ACL5_9LECA